MNLKIVETNGIPEIISGKVKIGSNILYQKYTKRGYRYDEVKSAMQKCVRVCNCDSLFFAKEIHDMNKKQYFSNLVNRCIVMGSEDVGMARPEVVYVIKLFLDDINSEEDVIEKEKKIIGIVHGLTLSEKNRDVDNIIHGILEGEVKEYPKDLQKFDIKKYNGYPKICVGKLFEPIRGDKQNFITLMNNFIFSLNEKDEISSCYWMQKIWELEDPNDSFREKSEFTLTKSGEVSKSKDPIYGVWEELNKRFKNKLIKEFDKNGNFLRWKQDYCVFKIDVEIFNSLFYFFDRKRKERSGRLFLIHAILYYCRWVAGNERPPYLSLDEIESRFKISNEKWNIIQQHENVPMKDEWIDVHTKRGKKNGKDIKDFFENGSRLENCNISDRYGKYSSTLAPIRKKEKVKPKKRKLKIIRKKTGKKVGKSKKNDKIFKVKTGKKRKREKRKNSTKSGLNTMENYYPLKKIKI